MARISGKTKIKSVVERLSGMKEKYEKIDSLLARNADEQLRSVDWDKLNTAISKRLDEARQSQTSTIRFPTVFKVAAGIAAAAAVVLITLMIRLERPAVEQLGDRRTAIVEFVEKKGSASVALIKPSDRAQVEISIAGKDERLANCYVQIIDSKAGQKEDVNRPSWFIICMSEYVNGNHGINSDAMDVLCLF